MIDDIWVSFYRVVEWKNWYLKTQKRLMKEEVMRKLLISMVVGLIVGVFSMAPAFAETASLRGTHNLDKGAEMFEKKRVVTQDGGFKRSWELQPPSIPHKISKETINLQGNSCMRCHSDDNYKKEKAVKIGDSHYLDRSGKKHKEVQARRYFCVQCHTTQVDAKPLVENLHGQ